MESRLESTRSRSRDRKSLSVSGLYEPQWEHKHEELKTNTKRDETRRDEIRVRDAVERESLEFSSYAHRVHACVRELRH